MSQEKKRKWKDKEPFKDSWIDDDVAGDDPPEHKDLPPSYDPMQNYLYHDEHSPYL